MTLPTLQKLALPGFSALPSQPFGPMQLVPLARERPVGELPLAPLTLARAREDVAPDDAKVVLVPHGSVTGFDERGHPLVAYGTQLAATRRGVERRLRTASLDLPIGRRDASARVRMVPLHLALEGLTLSSFDARPEAWARRARARRYDDSPRATRSAGAITASALRAFELHPRQCGLLLYAADTLLAAYAAPSPELYAALHRALVGDLLAGTVQWHLTRDAAGAHARPFRASLPGMAIRTLDDLREAVAVARRPWATAETALREGVAPSAVTARSSVRAAPFTLARVATSLALGDGNGLGEVVYRDDGALAWAMFHRISEAQTRRVYLLAQLAEAGWSPVQLAAKLGRSTRDDLARQLRNADLEHVLDEMAPGREFRGR